MAGITRASTIQIAQDLGYQVKEQNIYLTQLIKADEVFYTSSAINITPVKQIEQHRFAIGPISLELKKKFEQIISGQDNKYQRWLTLCQ